MTVVLVRIRLNLWLGFFFIALSLAACSDDGGGFKCGEGTVAQDGKCVAAPLGDAGDAARADAGETGNIGDTGGADVDESADAGPVPVVTELKWRQPSEFERLESGGRGLAAGAPLSLGIDVDFLGDRGDANTPLDLQFEVEGTGAVEQHMLHSRRVVFFTTSPGEVRVRVSVEQEQVGAPVQSDWFEFEILPHDDYDWSLKPRVYQDDIFARDAALKDMRFAGSAFNRVLPVDGEGQVVAMLLWKRKAGSSSWYDAAIIPARWLELSATGAAVDEDGRLTTSQAGQAEITASYAPPIDVPELAGTSSIEFVTESPLHSLEAAIAWDGPWGPKLQSMATSRVNAGELGLDYVGAQRRDPKLIYQPYLLDRTTFSSGRVIVVAHHIAGSVERVKPLQESWQDDEIYHDWWLGYRRVLSADEISVETNGKPESLDFDASTLELTPGSELGVRVLGLSAQGLAVPVVTGTKKHWDEDLDVSIQTSVSSLSFTDWEQCETFEMWIEVEGERLDLAPPQHLGVTNCSGGYVDGEPNPFPVETCQLAVGGNNWVACTRAAEYSSEIQEGYDTDGSLGVAAFGADASIPVTLDLPPTL